MITKPHLLLMACLLLACGRTSPEKKKEENTLLGLWNLQLMELFNDEAKSFLPYKDGMQGYVLYEGSAYSSLEKSGNMALYLATRDYQDFEPPFLNFSTEIGDSALKHLTNNYFYMAKYRLSGDTVYHRKLVHTNPAEWNQEVKRKFFFAGDTLILETFPDEKRFFRLKFLR